MLAAVSLGTGSNHAAQKWAGQWDFVHDTGGVTGGFAFRHETDENGPTLLQQIGGTPCTEPTDYFAGGYTVPDGTPPPPAQPPGEFIDTGKIRACVVDGNPSHIRGRYQSNLSGGTSGNIDLTLDASSAAWTGTFTVDGTPGTFGWHGTFDKHFEDGADDPSNPPYGTGSTTGGTTTGETATEDEPPPATCRIGTGGDDPVCKPPPKCNGKPATIYSQEDDAFGVPLFGTAGNDVIVGSAAGELIAGAGGKDLICGLAGDDTLIGGGGNDSIIGSAGDDSLNGGPGDDFLLGNANADRIRGGIGADELEGGGGSDTLLYDDDDTFINGGRGVDRCLGLRLRASVTVSCERES